MYCCQGLAPSIRADSYRSAGMFIRMPVAMSIRYGIPIQMLITMTVIRAQVGSSQKGSALSIQPRLISVPFRMPSLANILLTYSREMNWGMAMVITRMVRHSFLALMPFLLMAMATNMPRK